MAGLDDFAAFCGWLTLDNGRPMALEPFQRTMLADYFAGARETLVLIPKANGKSTTLGALALFELCTVPDAEIVIAAASRDQAGIMLRQAQGFIRRSEELRARLEVKQREIVHQTSGGRVRVLASDVDTSDGLVPSLALVDELHRHKNAELYAVLRDGLGKRGGRMVTISTAGWDRDSAMWRARQAAIEQGATRTGAYLRAGTPDGAFVLHEWSLVDDVDDADDLDTVKAANPLSTLTLEDLRVRRDSPSMRRSEWLRFACNIWTGSEVSWLPDGAWAACARPGQGIPQGADVVLGFDGSRTRDATALVAVSAAAPHHAAVVGCWENPDARDVAWRVPTGEVLDTIRDAAKYWRVLELAADDAFWLPELEALVAERLPVVKFDQRGRGMFNATQRAYELISAGQFTHDGDPDLARHISNVVPKYDLRGVRLAKDARNSTRKIDLTVALVMALERAAQLTAAPQFATVLFVGEQRSDPDGP